jgi:hypothetical protein
MVRIEKKVLFKLNGDEISLPDLLGMGHARAHVLALFEALEGEGLGEYRHGTKGRGQYSRFLKNAKCPNEYLLTLEEKPRGRRRNNASVETVEVSDSIVDSTLDSLAQNINSNSLIESADGIETREEEGEIPNDVDPDLTDLVAEMSIVRNTSADEEKSNSNDDLIAEVESAVISA